MAKNTAVFGIYSSYRSAESAVDALRTAGFRNTDISVMFPENVGTKDFAYEKGTKAPQGAATGAGTGVVVGGAVGWLAGIGTLAIPGLGPLIAAGPIMAALSGAGVGGTVGGLYLLNLQSDKQSAASSSCFHGTLSTRPSLRGPSRR